MHTSDLPNQQHWHSNYLTSSYLLNMGNQSRHCSEHWTDLGKLPNIYNSAILSAGFREYWDRRYLCGKASKLALVLPPSASPLINMEVFVFTLSLSLALYLCSVQTSPFSVHSIGKGFVLHIFTKFVHFLGDFERE